MLGNVVGVEAVTVESLDNLQSLLVILAQWQVVAVEMVENTKFHFALPCVTSNRVPGRQFFIWVERHVHAP